MEWWTHWSRRAAKLQVLHADAENRKKDDDNFYKMDKESIVTIREELSDDFMSLVGVHLSSVRWLIERLDDDHLGTQLQFQRERRRREVERMTTAINISDDEPFVDP